MPSNKKFDSNLALILQNEETRRIFQSSVDLLPVSFGIISSMGEVIMVNKEFSVLTGYTQKELVGRVVEDIFVEKAIISRLLKRVAKEGSVKNPDLTVVNKDIQEIPVYVAIVSSNPRNPDSKFYFLTLFEINDLKLKYQNLQEQITEQKKEIEKRIQEKEQIERELKAKLAELQNITQELKNSRAALLNILEDVEEARNLAETERDKTLAIIMNFPEGIMFLNEDNQLVSINPKVQQLFPGIEQFLNKDIVKNPPFFLGDLAIILKKTPPVLKQELSLKNNFILEVSVIDVKRREKKIGRLVILRDVTRERFIEKLKTEFVSISAHQLRTPLSAIKWTLRMILDGDVGPITDEQRELLEKSYQSNERMIYLINDLLNVTRIEEGRFIYRPKFSDIIEIAKKVIDPLKETAQRKGLEFVFEPPSSPLPKVKVDEEKIALVFQNLIDNAIHYTPPGGRVVVKITFQEEKKEILTEVSDTGIGIPKEQQKRVFTRFFRANNAIHLDTEGTGLGLYIAKNIIQAHKGRIWFKSQEGQGTTFYFTLPVAE